MGWLILSAVLMTISFLPWLGGVPVLFCLVPVIHHAMKVDEWKKRLWYGLAWGVCIFALNFYWAVHTMHTYGRMSYALSVILFIPLAVVQTIPFSLWYVLFPWLFRKHPVLPVLAFPFFVRLIPLIFPYSLASALSVNPLMIQTASIWGEWGLDAFIAGLGILIWQSLATGQRKIRWITVGVLTGFLLISTVQYLRPNRGGEQVGVAVLQPCVLDQDPPAVKEVAFFQSVREARGKVNGTLVVVPESSLPDAIVARADFFDVIGEVRRVLDARGILVNAVVYRNSRLTNSQFLMMADGSLDQYDKHRLMLFGERFPFYSLFRKLPIYAANFANFSPGTDIRPMAGDGLQIATPICLEAIFEDYVAELSREAGMIINPTDDEWFGPFHATWLHFSQVRTKAVETRRWLVRATNNGYTVAVDEKGRIRADIPAGRPGRMVIDVPQLYGVTVYQRIARWMPWLFGLAIIVLYFGGSRWRRPS